MDALVEAIASILQKGENIQKGDNYEQWYRGMKENYKGLEGVILHKNMEHSQNRLDSFSLK